MKWILILVTFLFSSYSFAGWVPAGTDIRGTYYSYNDYPGMSAGEVCELGKSEFVPSSYYDGWDGTVRSKRLAELTPCGWGATGLNINYDLYKIPAGEVDSSSCDGGYPIYPETECKPNYCDTEESFQAAENAVLQCASGVPFGQVVSENTATCNRDTETIDSVCVYSTVGDGGDGGGSDGSGDDGIGGGDGGSGDIGSGDGGSGNGDTGTTTDNICSQYPDLCVTGDCVPPPDMPWVCDVPTGEGTDLIAKVSEITRLLAINNSSTEQDVLNSAMSLVNDDAEINNQVKTLDKLETIKSNSKATADNTNKITDHLQNITDLNKYQNELLGKLIDKPSGDGVPSDLMAGVESKLDGIKAELSKSFCQKNPTHNDCRNIVISDAYQDVFNSPELSNMAQKTADIKNELQSKIDDFKNLLGNPNIQAGGAIDEINFTLAHAGKQIEVSNTAAQDIGVQVKALVLAVFSVMGLMIICRR